MFDQRVTGEDNYYISGIKGACLDYSPAGPEWP